MRLRLNVRIMASCLLVLAGLTACGGPLIPDKELVDQFLATRSMELVKEVIIRYFAVSDEFYYSTRKYPAFVPLLDNPGQGVLVLPTPNNMSGSKYQLMWLPESDIRVSGEYGDLSKGDFTNYMGWYLQQYSEKVYSGGPEFSLGTYLGYPFLVGMWTNSGSINTGVVVLDTVGSPGIDQRGYVGPRTVSPVAWQQGPATPPSNSRDFAFHTVGGLLRPQVFTYAAAMANINTIAYMPTYSPPPSEMFSGGSFPTGTQPYPPQQWFDNPTTIFLGGLNGFAVFYDSFVASIYDGQAWKRMRLGSLNSDPMTDSPYRPLHAENNVVVLETDDQGKFFLPEQGNKEINAPGMKFLQAYRKANGELWFLFTQTIRSATNHEGTTLRTWGYKY